MASNLVSLVMQFPNTRHGWAHTTVLGVDRNKIQSAISAGVPTLLAVVNDVRDRVIGPSTLRAIKSPN